MKTKFKVLIMALCFLLCAVESQAQYIGFSYSAGTTKDPVYKFKGNHFHNMNFGATYEQVVTPHFSVRTGLLYRWIDVTYGVRDYFLANSDDDYYYSRGEFYVDRLSLPIGVEYKILLSNRFRAYVNTDVLFNYKIYDTCEEYCGWESHSNEDMYAVGISDDFNVGLATGFGFEFGCIRVGFRYDFDLYKVNDALNNRLNSLAIEGGLRFGGSKLFRKKSYAKTASVPYPILDHQTATPTTASQKPTPAPAKKATVAPKAKIEPKAEVTAAPVAVKEKPAVVEPVAEESEPKQNSEQSSGALCYVRVGMNFAKISNEYDDPDYKNMRKLGYYFSYGFHKPISIMNIDNFYWGTEFALGTRGYKEKENYDDYSSKYTLLAHNIQAAQNIGYKYKLPISKINLTVDAHLGLYASYDYAGKFVDEYDGGEKYEETISELNEWYKDETGERLYNRGDIGIAYGFGVWYNNKYNFEFAFQNGLVNPFHDTDYKYRSRNFMLRLGYAF